ncbi:MAG: CsgG/HfaB family protein [Verrucomicrobiota bacterium]
MRETIIAFVFIFFSASALAAPARLALIVENPLAASTADLLTVELSKHEQAQVLERDQIEKILREQKISAAGVTEKDFLKLGQILGVDGLIFLDVLKEKTNSFLTMRLVAVKQGVVLDFLQTPSPIVDAIGWAEGTAKRVATFIPKLQVLAKDAVPISILNLRSAASSSEASQLERELTLLLVNRLMREREIFVLERRRLDALGSEKDLNKDESPFWGGSYLLEGIIDKEGFSREQVTISARVVPPNGGTAAQIELAGKRSDLPLLIDQLTKKDFIGASENKLRPGMETGGGSGAILRRSKMGFEMGHAS